METASISDPIIKNTASLIKLEATPLGESIPRTTSIISIKSATAGIGIDSEIINIRAVTTMIRVRWPSAVRPSAVGK
jgi:hypothetical protein